MNSCYLDANLLVYFKSESSDLYIQSKSLLKRASENNLAFSISPLCIDEFLYASIKEFARKKLPIDKYYLQYHLKSILTLPNLSILNPPIDPESQLEVISLMQKYSLRPRDAYHLLIMRSNKIKYFATFDRDFDKVFQANIVKRFK